MIDVRPATRADAEFIASHLRVEDRAEVEAATGRSPLEIVPESFDLSTQCYTIRHASVLQVDDLPCAIFGVADDPTTEGLGLVWLLATADVFNVRGSVLAAAPHYINAMSARYPLGLHNVVDHRNLLHLRWCLKTGFVEIGQVDVNGFPFHHIYRPNPAGE
jgi:hypothetical protein